jgi:hypothetical protein
MSDTEAEPPLFDLFTDETVCVICGCTDSRPCLGGCWWVPPAGMGDICSRCQPALFSEAEVAMGP